MTKAHFDLNLLRALDALLAERNVTRAAERQFVTQQAMSGTLARLRAHFGGPVPAVMISADRGKDLKVRLDACGIPLLSKPVKPAQLRALLRTMLK
ncbi:MAG: LysR family transcriptional regulator [Sphingobium sp.]|nr:LysR family transcriptional regulator [Sphingobium sp.]